MKKFIVAVVAALALSLCVLPMSVFADDGGDAGVFAMNQTSVGGEVISIGGANVTGPVAIFQADVAAVPNKVYTGKAIQPTPQLTIFGYTLKKGTDYTVTYKNNVNVGTATMTIKGTGNFVGEMPCEFSIIKASNSITKYTSKKTLKYKTLKKRAQAFKIAAVDKFKAKKTYKLTKVPKKAKKYIKVSKAGKVTVKKGIKKGTYKIKVRITAPATKNYKALKVTKQITIKVK